MIKEIVATFLFLNFKVDKQTPHLNTNSCLEFKKFHGKREKDDVQSCTDKGCITNSLKLNPLFWSD